MHYITIWDMRNNVSGVLWLLQFISGYTPKPDKKVKTAQ